MNACLTSDLVFLETWVEKVEDIINASANPEEWEVNDLRETVKHRRQQIRDPAPAKAGGALQSSTAQS